MNPRPFLNNYRRFGRASCLCLQIRTASCPTRLESSSIPQILHDVYSASPVVAHRFSLPQDYFIRRHAVYIVVSLIILVAFSFLNAKVILHLSFVSFILFITLMIAVITFGIEAKGAKRLLHIFKISIQPYEFIRPFFSVVVDSILVSGMKFKMHISIIIFMLVFVLLLLKPDFSMSMLPAFRKGFLPLFTNPYGVLSHKT
jgi:cell division protein FtsW (lipid II flippase)